MKHNYQICTKSGIGNFKVLNIFRASSPTNAETKFRTQRITPRNWTYYVVYQGIVKKTFKIHN